VSEVTLYREIRCGRFPAVKIRGRYVIPARVVAAMEDAAVETGALVSAADWVTQEAGEDEAIHPQERQTPRSSWAGPAQAPTSSGPALPSPSYEQHGRSPA